MLKNKPLNFEEYINELPESVIKSLIEIKDLIQKTNTKAENTISYGMPAFKYKGKPLAYFAAFKNHIGFYPTASGIKAVEKELSKFKYSKGAIQFPYDKKIPFALIKKIIKIRTAQIEYPSIPQRGKLNAL